MKHYYDYIFIRAWGNKLGSYNYYIVNQQTKALLENAPLNAIFKGSDGEWKTMEDIKGDDQKLIIYREAERIRAVRF